MQLVACFLTYFSDPNNKCNGVGTEEKKLSVATSTSNNFNHFIKGKTTINELYRLFVTRLTESGGSNSLTFFIPICLNIWDTKKRCVCINRQLSGDDVYLLEVVIHFLFTI